MGSCARSRFEDNGEYRWEGLSLEDIGVWEPGTGRKLTPADSALYCEMPIGSLRADTINPTPIE